VTSSSFRPSSVEEEQRYWFGDPTPHLGPLYPHNTYHGQTSKPHHRTPLNLDFKPIRFTDSPVQLQQQQHYPVVPVSSASAAATPTTSSKQRRRVRRRSSNASNENAAEVSEWLVVLNQRMSIYTVYLKWNLEMSF
jgi:hypothetical protein